MFVKCGCIGAPQWAEYCMFFALVCLDSGVSPRFRVSWIFVKQGQLFLPAQRHHFFRFFWIFSCWQPYGTIVDVVTGTKSPNSTLAYPFLSCFAARAKSHLFITGSIACSATRRYLSYSEADFEVSRPSGATRCKNRPFCDVIFHSQGRFDHFQWPYGHAIRWVRLRTVGFE